LQKGRPADFLPNFFYTEYELDFTLGFGWLVGFVVFFYHLSCKRRLPALLSDLHKHLVKKFYSFFIVLLCCPTIATVQEVKKDKKVGIIFIGWFCESLFG